MVVLALFSLAGIDLVGWIAQPKTWVDPAKGISIAGKTPINLGSRCVPPAPGLMPRLTSGMLNRVPLTHTRK